METALQAICDYGYENVLFNLEQSFRCLCGSALSEGDILAKMDDMKKPLCFECSLLLWVPEK